VCESHSSFGETEKSIDISDSDFGIDPTELAENSEGSEKEKSRYMQALIRQLEK